MFCINNFVALKCVERNFLIVIIKLYIKMKTGDYAVWADLMVYCG